MATINIPEKVYPGFKILHELSENKIKQIIDYLKSLDVDSTFDDVADKISTILDSKSGNIFLRTLLSFSSLLDEEDVDIQDLANNLTESYIEQAEVKIQPKVKNKLSSNLYKIFLNYGSLKLIRESRELSIDNENNLQNFKLITDIRIVFNEDINDKKNRVGIILHKILFDYEKNMDYKELHLTLSLDDLKKLKLEIDKAILKDQVIRDEFKSTIKIIS